MKKLLTIATLTTILISCSTNGYYGKISGEWECASWINARTGADKCSNNVYFIFNADKSYKSTLGNVKDSGDYKIFNDKLYVYPIGKMEVAVEITKLNADSLVFLMNQAGDEEILTLIRK